MKQKNVDNNGQMLCEKHKCHSRTCPACTNNDDLGKEHPASCMRVPSVECVGLNMERPSISRMRVYAVMMFSTAKSRLWMKRMRCPIILQTGRYHVNNACTCKHRIAQF